MEVFLNSYDLYKMGRFLGFSHTEALFREGLVRWAPGQNGLTLPRIRFKTRPYPFCPFLVNDYREDRGLLGFCSLHPDHKPLVCRLAPLTRELDLAAGEDRFGFVPPHPACPGCGQGEPLDEGAARDELKDELDREREFYRLLAEMDPANPREVEGLFLFPLDRPFSLPPA